MDEANDRADALARLYAARWHTALPVVQAWDAVAGRSGEPAVGEALARHLAERVGILVIDLAVMYKDAMAGQLWSVEPQRLIDDLTIAQRAVRAPLALLLHHVVLDGAFRILRRELVAYPAHDHAVLALDVLLAGLTEVGVPVPPRLAQPTPHRAPTSCGLEPPLGDVELDERLTAPMVMHMVVPPALLAALDQIARLDGHLEILSTRLTAWRSRRDTLRRESAPMDETLPRTHDERLEDSRTILPGMHAPVAMERLTMMEREVVLGYKEGNSRGHIARTLGISVGAVSEIRGRARTNSTFSAVDALLWEAAGLNNATWAVMQRPLEAVTPIRGKGEKPPYRSGGPRPISSRLIVASIIIACRTGLAWDELSRLPSWLGWDAPVRPSPMLPPCSLHTVERRLRAWQEADTWSRVRSHLTSLLPTEARIDLSRARPGALGTRAPEPDLPEIVRVMRLLEPAVWLIPIDSPDRSH